jgi:hypothetical protein
MRRGRYTSRTSSCAQTEAVRIQKRRKDETGIISAPGRNTRARVLHHRGQVMSRFRDPIVKGLRALHTPRQLLEGHGRRPLWLEQAQRGRSVKWHRGRPGARWRGVVHGGLQGNLITQRRDECTWRMTLHSCDAAPYDKEVMTWAASTRISSCDPAASSNCSGAFRHFTRLDHGDNNIRSRRGTEAE